MKELKLPAVATPEQVIFLQCFYFVLVAKNHQKIQSGCLIHEFSFKYIFKRY